MTTKISPRLLSALLTWAGNRPGVLPQLESPDAHPETFNPDCYDLDAATDAVNEHIEEVHGGDPDWMDAFTYSFAIWDILAIHFDYARVE